MPERTILLTGKAKQVFEEIRLASVYRGEVTIGELARPDLLELEKQAEAWRTLQEQIEESDDKKKE